MYLRAHSNMCNKRSDFSDSDDSDDSSETEEESSDSEDVDDFSPSLNDLIDTGVLKVTD